MISAFGVDHGVDIEKALSARFIPVARVAPKTKVIPAGPGMRGKLTRVKSNGYLAATKASHVVASRVEKPSVLGSVHLPVSLK